MRVTTLLILICFASGALAADSASKDYGLISCGKPDITAALSKAGNGILKCTVKDKTHRSDVGGLWGGGTWLNDNYFGTHGGLYIADQNQQDVFKREIEKIAKFIKPTSAKNQLAPYEIDADGISGSSNPIGMDLDRFLEFILSVIRVCEFSGDLDFANRMYPHLLTVIDWMRQQNQDSDVLIEGRTMNEAVTAVGTCTSLTYIGDTVRNNYKDFAVSMFYYDALMHLAKLEDLMDKKTSASTHRADAERIKAALSEIMWNPSGRGYLAWIEPNGLKQDYWVTGNNLHAVQCGLANQEQTAMIMEKLKENQASVIDVVPCRTVIGVYAKGVCSNPENYYWNGGCWTLVAAPAMLAYRKTNDLDGAFHVMDVLANKVPMTEFGYYESYWGDSGKQNVCPGLLMNNGGVLWGFFAGVLGMNTFGDKIIFTEAVPKDILPVKARIRYRSSDLEITWSQGTKTQASLDGVSCKARNGCYEFKIPSNINRPTHSIDIVAAVK